MTHPDTAWRVGAIYRACKRHGKDRAWAYDQLDRLRPRSADGKIIDRHNITNLADIWFRGVTSHMDQAREACK